MSQSKDVLSQFSKRERRFFEIKDGEEFTVKYLRAEEIESPFKPGKKLIRYFLEVDGKEMMWDRESKQLSQAMSEVDEGSTIRIQRHGKKNETKYDVSVVG